MANFSIDATSSQVSSTSSSAASSPVRSIHSAEDDQSEEPLDMYKKINHLCQHLWHHSRVVVESAMKAKRSKMFPVSITDSKGLQKRYIMQLPHVPSDIELIVAIHDRFYNNPVFEGLATADVAYHDSGFDNSVMQPYIIFTQVAGRSIRDVWPKLNHMQRVALAREVGKLYSQLQSITSEYSGLLKVPVDEFGDCLEGDLVLNILGKEESPVSNMIDWAAISNGKGNLLCADNLHEDASNMTAREIAILAFQRRSIRSATVSRDLERQYADQAVEVLKEIASDGLLDDNTICLWHRDPSAKHIMVQVNSAGEPNITGLLGWDGLGYAPRFVTCRPPQWLWSRGRGRNVSFAPLPYDDIPSDSRGYPEIDTEPFEPFQPVNEQTKEIKRVFDEAVGKDFNDAAYEPRLIVARRLMYVAACSRWEQYHLDELETVLKEWQQYRLAEAFWDSSRIEE